MGGRAASVALEPSPRWILPPQPSLSQKFRCSDASRLMTSTHLHRDRALHMPMPNGDQQAALAASCSGLNC